MADSEIACKIQINEKGRCEKYRTIWNAKPLNMKIKQFLSIKVETILVFLMCKTINKQRSDKSEY